MVRVLAVSDLHVDHPSNLEWVVKLSDTEYQDDVIIVAGDVTHKLSLLEETLAILQAKFADVFFTPGNHDLWLDSSSSAPSTSSSSSFGKLDDVLSLCARMGVQTTAKKMEIEGTHVWIVPIFSWYHASWDREADWPDALPPRKVIADFRACKWPDHLSPHDDSLAREFDKLNDPELGNLETVLDLERDSAFEKNPLVISFSHFVPRSELIPEKSKLFYKNLPKAVGSDYLERRIEELKSDVHVFGHTHFSWDCYIGGTRYVQWPLAYPKEQERRRKYGISQTFSSSGQPPQSGASAGDAAAAKTPHPFAEWKPLVVYDSAGVTPCKRTYWCNHYQLSTQKQRAKPAVPLARGRNALKPGGIK
mmetsp:Transcript_2239/g.6137  ORF Transcript_2239/g.6137 Transcript_2239/m.6137 type:complete len:363 (+) Transcript_2239:43-1131(+)